jgi:type III pantothenate kinase
VHSNSHFPFLIYWGYISLIEGLLNKLKKENDCLNAQTIATGGLSKLFSKDLNCINYFENDLTLNGLIIISKKIYE